MLKSKLFQVALLAVAAIGFGLAPAGDALAGGSCNSNRPSHDRWHSSKHYDHRPSHDRWHGKSYGKSHGTSYHYRSSSHHDYSHSRASVSYRNDNVRFSVSVGSGHHYDHHKPTYRSSSSCDTTVVYQHPQSGYWKRVYHSPVYETRYDSCGRPYRVCVREGYYERVWVSTGRYR